jgi:hypothetical protein
LPQKITDINDEADLDMHSTVNRMLAGMFCWHSARETEADISRLFGMVN